MQFLAEHPAQKQRVRAEVFHMESDRHKEFLSLSLGKGGSDCLWGLFWFWLFLE